MHIPSTDTKNIEVTGFDAALDEYESRAHADFSAEDWLYIPPHYSEYRYILGTKGKRPLICVGINPSTAAPGKLDNTLKSVERIALANGFDSFIMFNVYAERATNPDDMDTELNEYLHGENMKAFEYVLKRSDSPAIWAAWGTIIEKRPYLPGCVWDMIELGEKYGARWFTSGKISTKGHPHHPLYLKKDSPLEKFDIKAYTADILKFRKETL